jgi:pimeloyl-ACP methyl ester carboxylesterase
VTGTLFSNPGGPGASGFVTLFPMESFRENFHLVTWDPRGVGKSRPQLRNCPDAPMLRLTQAPVPAPAIGPFEWSQIAAARRSISAQSKALCFNNSFALASQLGTNNVIRDLEAMRAAVGDRQLNYYGYSYGTRIGRLYAQIYPNRVRAMVLDGVVDPQESMEDMATLATRGGKAAFKYIRRDMTEKEWQATRKLNSALAKTQISDGVDSLSRFDLWALMLGVARNEHSQLESITGICAIAKAAVGADCGNGVSAMSQRNLRKVIRQARKRVGPSDMTSLINAVDLVGRPDDKRIGSYISAWARTDRLRGQVAGLNGNAYGTTAQGLPPAASPVPSLPKKTRVSTPPLLINGKGDLLTPFAGAKQTHKRLIGSRLISVNTSFHGIFLGDEASKCVRKPIHKYLNRAKLPRKDRTCRRP